MLQWTSEAQYAGLTGAAAVYLGLMYVVDRRWARYQHRLHIVDIAQSSGEPAADLRMPEAAPVRRQSRG
jgi:hypothetical protein